MDVGVQMVFAGYGWSNMSDAEVWDEELRLARLAADVGFDVLWSNAADGLFQQPARQRHAPARSRRQDGRESDEASG